MATIRRVPTIEHHFQLVITRVYEDGDQEFLEDEEETDEERVFLISEELEFRTGEAEGSPCFLWRDLHGDVDEFWEYLASGTNEPTRAFFETCMYRAMYERKYKKSPDAGQDADLEEFIWRPPALKAKPKPRRKVSAKASAKPEPSSSAAVPPVPFAEPRRDSTEEKAKAVAKVASSTPSMETLMSSEAELYLWDPTNNSFHNQGILTASIMRRIGSGYEYWLTATHDTKHLLAHMISDDMNQRFSHKMFTLTWNHVGEEGAQNSWLFRFGPDDFGPFLQKFTVCMWESLHQSQWAKAKTDEQHYVLSAVSEDVEMRDVEDEEEEEEEVVSELDPDEEASDEEDEEEEMPQGPPRGDHNSQLTVGYKGDRSYVVRGNNIGVFNHSVGSNVKYYATISKIATPKGKEFKPKNVRLKSLLPVNPLIGFSRLCYMIKTLRWF